MISVFNSTIDLVNFLFAPSEEEVLAAARDLIRVELFELKHNLEAQAHSPRYYQAIKQFNAEVAN